MLRTTTSLPSHVFAFQNTGGTLALVTSAGSTVRRVVATRARIQGRQFHRAECRGVPDLQHTCRNLCSVFSFLTVAAISTDLDDEPASAGRCVRNRSMVDTSGLIRSGSYT